MNLGSRNAGAEPQNGAEDFMVYGDEMESWSGLCPVKGSRQLHQARKSASAMLLFGA